MPADRSAGIIIFRETSRGRTYLLLRSSDREFWDFPKGILDSGESAVHAARREAQEETGITDVEIIPLFKETLRYFTRREGKPTLKFVAMFLGRVADEKVRLSWEHDTALWLPYHEAHERISLPQMKRALEKAEAFLSSSTHSSG